MVFHTAATSRKTLSVRFFQPTQTQWLRGLSLSVSAAILLASSNAFAATSPGSIAGLKQTEPQDTPTDVPPIEEATRFTCEYIDGQFTVMYHPESQPGQSYAWATPTELGGGWTEERRCDEISRRLESYRPDGLQEMQTSTLNGYDVVCVTTERNSDCRLVFTVPPGQDPIATRDRVFENLTVADSGQQTDAVTTFTDSDGNILNQIGDALNINLPNLGDRRNQSNGINLRPFLDRADGGTGARLQPSASTQPSLRLNPERFR
jgi:hypothetical protein